ncbi:hypothetical protein N337_12831, partial [Phoenicopterus ruber ruber]
HSTRITINRDARSLLTPCLQGVLIPRARTAEQRGAHHWHMRMGFFLFFFLFLFLFFSCYKDFC